MDILPEEFFPAYEKLLKLSVNSYIETDSHESNQLNRRELGILISTASITSLHDDAKMQSLSYEICSRLIESHASDDVNILAGTDMILSRIGNFPGRQLLRNKFFDDKDIPLPFSLSIERLIREIENSNDSGVKLTDFQYKLYSSLKKEVSLSISAPTSAGKSFILNLDLTRRLKSESKQCIVYIVPTRALVTEVVSRVRAAIRDESIEGVAVRTAPFPVTNSDEFLGVVYVLTQERLLSLLSASKPRTTISLLIVDEAHELQKGKRGILLQNAIDLALSQSPALSIFFASPLIKNPGYFLSVFSRHKNGHFFTEEVSPVSQNIILISPIKNKTNEVDVGLLRERSTIKVGKAKTNFPFRGSIHGQKAKFAVNVCGADESAIIFANSAADAEKSATCVASALGPYDISEELADFIKFIRTDIHPEYPLVETLTQGVGFHYGNMPSIVRTGVEKLFKEGTIRFLCSTSTLLQGVNLPAKHIVIYNPHLGNDPMLRADFRNLAGRAGRLLKEFHGNIWCIRPTEWDVPSFQGENLQEVRTAMSEVMEDGGSLIKSLVEGNSVDRNKDLADAAFSRLYHEVHDGDESLSRAINNYSTPENFTIFNENISALKELEISIPKTILDSHRGLRPDFLQRLYNEIKSVSDIEQILLLNPHEMGGKQRMSKAISLIHRSFDIEMTEPQYRLICGVAHDWAWGKPIGEIISTRVDYKRSKNSQESTSQIIRDLLQLVEKEVRFNLVRYFAAFEDLLHYSAIESGNNAKPITIAPYHVYLEFGSSDKITLGLMALGLSRFSAIKLSKATNWGDAKEPEDILKRINRSKINSLNLPKICLYEIGDILGTS
ncbi:MAG: DEAD/DEAH box helicase [Bdellovibrionales bacterium]|nr:DEAD/DEAH box helicase [Bdellovibrionales bacterium]